MSPRFDRRTPRRHHLAVVQRSLSWRKALCIGSSTGLGSIAQLGEHLPYKQRVTGSSPVVPTNKNTSQERCFFVAETARTYGRFAAMRIAHCAPRVTADAPFLSQATSLSLFYEPCPPTNKNTSQERCFFVDKRLEPTAASRPRAPRVVPLDK